MRQVLENETSYGTIRNQINSNFEELYSEKGILIFDFMKKRSTIIDDEEFDRLIADIEAQIPIYVHITDDTHSQYIFPVLKVAKNVLDDKGQEVYALTYNTYIDSGVDVYSEIITISTSSPHVQGYTRKKLGFDEKQDKIKIFEFNNIAGQTFAMSNDEYAELLQCVNNGKLAYVKIKYGKENSRIYPMLECKKAMLNMYIVITYNTLVNANKEVYSQQIKVATSDSAHTVSYDNVALGFANKQDKESSELQTTNKTIVGAINELNGSLGAGDICILDVDTYNHDTDYNTIYNAVKNNKIIIIAGNETANDNTTKRYFVANSTKSSNGFELKFYYDNVTYTVSDTDSNTNGIQLSRLVNNFYISTANDMIEPLNNVIIAAFTAISFGDIISQMNSGIEEARFNISIVQTKSDSNAYIVKNIEDMYIKDNSLVIRYIDYNDEDSTDKILNYTIEEYSVTSGSKYSTMVERVNTLFLYYMSDNTTKIYKEQYSELRSAINEHYNIIVSGSPGYGNYRVSGTIRDNDSIIKLLYIDDVYMHIYNISTTENSNGTHTVTKETKKLAFDTST